MFTYICPKCGREVPPAYSECPDCAAKEAGITLPPLVVREPSPAPPRPVEQEPAAGTPQAPSPESGAASVSPISTPSAPLTEAAAAPPVSHAPGWAAPMWLLAILFAFASLGVVLGSVWLVSAVRGGNRQSAAIEAPASAAGAATSPLQRYVEISGLRYAEDPKDKNKTVVKFVLTNHSDADLPGVSGNVTLLGHTPKAVVREGSFTFTTDLPPGAVKDLSAPLDTKKMIYELPDWQNASAELQITGPGAGSAGSPERR
jgi:hypothetical protein